MSALQRVAVLRMNSVFIHLTNYAVQSNQAGAESE